MAGLLTISGEGTSRPPKMALTEGCAATIWTAKQPKMTDQQRDDEGLEEAEALVHQVEQQESVERGDDGAGDQRDAEQQVQRDRGADDLGEVAGDDGELAGDPQQERDRTRIVGPAGLRQIPAGGDAKPGG